MTMKIITYNVNGLRAAVSKGMAEWRYLPSRNRLMWNMEWGWNWILHENKKR